MIRSSLTPYDKEDYRIGTLETKLSAAHTVVAVVVVQVMVKLAGQTVSWAAAVGPMEIGIVRDWLSHVIRIAAADDTEDRSGKTVMVPDYLIGYHIADFARQTLCFAEKQSSEIPDLELHFGVDFVAAATGSWLH